MTPTGKENPNQYANLGIQMSGPSNVLGPLVGRSGRRSRRRSAHALGSAGKATLWMPDANSPGNWRPTGGQKPARSFESNPADVRAQQALGISPRESITWLSRRAQEHEPSAGVIFGPDRPTSDQHVDGPDIWMPKLAYWLGFPCRLRHSPHFVQFAGQGPQQVGIMDKSRTTPGVRFVPTWPARNDLFQFAQRRLTVVGTGQIAQFAKSLQGWDAIDRQEKEHLRATVAGDHVQFIVDQQRIMHRMREQQRDACLKTFFQSLCPIVVFGPRHEHRIGQRSVQYAFPMSGDFGFGGEPRNSASNSPKP